MMLKCRKCGDESWAGGNLKPDYELEWEADNDYLIGWYICYRCTHADKRQPDIFNCV